MAVITCLPPKMWGQQTSGRQFTTRCRGRGAHGHPGRPSFDRPGRPVRAWRRHSGRDAANAGTQAGRQPRCDRPQQDRCPRRALRRRPGRRRPDACGAAHHLRAGRWFDHRGARPPGGAHRGGVDLRGAQLQPSGRPPAGRDHRRGGRPPGRRIVLRVGCPRHRRGPDRRNNVEVRRRQRSRARRRHRAGAQLELRVLRPTHRVRPLPVAPPDRAQGHREPAVLPHARRLRPGDEHQRGDRVLQPDLGARVPAVQPHAVQLGHLPPADVELLSARQPGGLTRRHL